MNVINYVIVLTVLIAVYLVTLGAAQEFETYQSHRLGGDRRHLDSDDDESEEDVWCRDDATGAGPCERIIVLENHMVESTAAMASLLERMEAVEASTSSLPSVMGRLQALEVSMGSLSNRVTALEELIGPSSDLLERVRVLEDLASCKEEDPVCCTESTASDDCYPQGDTCDEKFLFCASCGEEDRLCSSGEICRDGSCQQARGESCAEILQDDPRSVSGVYWIEPVFGGGQFEAYCDMETDGGGWTLVGAWGSDESYTMYNYKDDGLRVGEVKESFSTPRAYGTGPAHYSKAVIDALFLNGDSHEYLTLTGAHLGGWVLMRLEIPNPPTGFDPFQAVIRSEHVTDDFSGGVDYIAEVVSGTSSSNNLNPLPISSPTWRPPSFGMYGRGCAYPPEGYCSNGFHYLPDDIDGAGQWMFREYPRQRDIGTPFDVYPDSSNVPSLLFIR